MIGLILFSWHRTDNVTFDLRYLIVDSNTEKASLMKIGQGCALVVSTWGFIVLISTEKMTEWYFTLYMTIWAGANLANKWIEQKKEQ